MRALSYGGDVGLRAWPPLVKTPQLRRVAWPSAQQESEDTFDMLDALLGKDVDIPPAAPRRYPPSPPSKPLRPPVEAKREEMRAALQEFIGAGKAASSEKVKNGGLDLVQLPPAAPETGFDWATGLTGQAETAYRVGDPYPSAAVIRAQGSLSGDLPPPPSLPPPSPPPPSPPPPLVAQQTSTAALPAPTPAPATRPVVTPPIVPEPVPTSPPAPSFATAPSPPPYPRPEEVKVSEVADIFDIFPSLLDGTDPTVPAEDMDESPAFGAASPQPPLGALSAMPTRPPPSSSEALPVPTLMHSPVLQLVLCAAGYLAHVCILSRRSIVVGKLALGWDTLAGCAVLLAAMTRRVRLHKPPVPPWLIGRAAEDATACANFASEPRGERIKLLSTVALLLCAPFLFSFAAPLVEALVSLLVLLGLPLTRARTLSVRLLLEQTILNLGLFQLVRMRHPGFFSHKWVRWRWQAPWIAEVLGGYAASVALFNLIEPLNQALLPGLAYKPEGLVAQLANPTDRSAASLLLAAIAPCLGAPIFEELQSRAFILQALTAAMPIGGALLVSGILFGAQHLQIGLLLPLSVTGFFWGVLYVNSRNLLVPVFIHALWNGRIFLGSYLGL